MRPHAIGFGSLNLDEFWEVGSDFLESRHIHPGHEYVQNLDWFHEVYPILQNEGTLRGVDPGGSAANTIAALRRMGFETGFFGVVGSDKAASMRLSQLGNKENLFIRKSDLPSGRCLSLIDRDDPEKDRALVILPNANDEAAVEEPAPSVYREFQWVHMTSFVSHGPLEVQIKLAESLEGETLVSFDPGAIYSARGFTALEPLLKRTEVLFVTRDELEELTDYAEDPLKSLFDIGVGIVVVKLGSEGITVFQPGLVVHRPARPPRFVKDRTGAGDVAAAGFLAGKILGLAVEECLDLAVAVASKSIEGYGRSAYPDRDFLNEMVGHQAGPGI